MRLQIKSRVLGRVLTFSKTDDGESGQVVEFGGFKVDASKTPHYVRVELGFNGPEEWRQICAGGRFCGSTVACMDADFERVCRAWYRAYVKNIREA